MKFKEAYCTNKIDPKSGPRRLVFDMPGGNYLVLKYFGSADYIGPADEGATVKLWSGSLDYERMVRSWRTDQVYFPSPVEIQTAFHDAITLLESCGLRPTTFVIGKVMARGRP